MHCGISFLGMGSGLWLMIWSMDHEIIWLEKLMRFLGEVRYWLDTDRRYRNTYETDIGNSITILGIIVFSLSLLYLYAVVSGKGLRFSKSPAKETKRVD
jgi:hypothetical protein